MADLRPTAEMRRGLGLDSLDIVVHSTTEQASAPDRQPLHERNRRR
jgi:hypothetical protein